VEKELFADQMVGVDYEESTLADMQHLLPVTWDIP
jgi:hypothetical protein